MGRVVSKTAVGTYGTAVHCVLPCGLVGTVFLLLFLSSSSSCADCTDGHDVLLPLVLALLLLLLLLVLLLLLEVPLLLLLLLLLLLEHPSFLWLQV